MRIRFQLVAAVMSALALVTAGVVLLTMFDPGAVLRAAEGADFSLVVVALVLGAILQALRAQRAKLMLRRERPITLEQSFGAQVISHAAGRIVPVGPASFGLQCVLIRRLANISIPFSAGVLMGCNILDRLSVLPLVALALYGMRLPGWLRLLLLGTLIQSAFFLLVPLIATITRSRLGRYAPRSGWGRKLRAALADVEHGLATLVAGGWRLALSAIALSFLITAGSILRLSLLLGAFELSASPHQLMLLLVMSGLMGSLPVTLPGAEAWATGKLLRLVRVLGPGAGGFVLLSNVIAVLETPLLAAGILLWWALPRSDVSLRLGELLALARQPGADHPPVGDAA